MIEQDTIKLLRECDAGVKMGVSSIDDVLGQVRSGALISYDCWELRRIITDEEATIEERDAAVVELEQLANADDPHAQYIMGLLYRDGGLLVPDTEKACRWLELSARELPDAQYALGKLYLSDDLDVHEPAKGIYWLKRATETGHEYAAYRLGREYLSGKYVQKDAMKATACFQQAAGQGNPYAQYLLGKLYLMGKGVTEDKDTARYWFSMAEQNGHVYAGFFLDRMERQEETELAELRRQKAEGKLQPQAPEGKKKGRKKAKKT